MNFLALQYFVTVAEELNITKAAERLYISQQSLSKHIIKLEKDLGLKLFERAPVFALTYAGKRFLRAAVHILDSQRQIIMEMDDINNHRRGELRIGISHTRGRVLLPKILPFFAHENPLIEISVKEGNSKELEEWLLHGQIDLLIGFSPITLDVAETIDILHESLFLVIPQKFIIDAFPNNYEEKINEFQKGIEVDIFKDCPFLLVTSGNRIRTLFDHYINSRGISINITLEIESIETLLSLACEGMGATIYPEMFVKNLSPLVSTNIISPVQFFPLNDPETKAQLVIAFHRERYLSEAAKNFIDICIKKMREFYN